ncbi:hypothetical protein U1Q18_009997 [Sarracenia purpurea var. burkii]
MLEHLLPWMAALLDAGCLIAMDAIWIEISREGIQSGLTHLMARLGCCYCHCPAGASLDAAIATTLHVRITMRK